MLSLCERFDAKAELIGIKNAKHHFFITDEDKTKWLGEIFDWLRKKLLLEDVVNEE